MSMAKVLIIAEAGVNHNGDVGIAKQLIEKAADAGADYVKFQTFRADSLAAPQAGKAAYQRRAAQDGESQREMLKRLELTEEMHGLLKSRCQECGIGFLSSAFDLDGIELLDRLGVDFYKIPSGEITNLPYLEKTGAKGKGVVLSTGMATMEEVRAAVNALQSAGAGSVCVLHCTTQYPTPYEDVNLNAMKRMREELGLPVGYSDHTRGIEVAVAAVSMGATVIEKHFTLDRTMEGPDHAASLEPEELKAMVTAIRNVEKALGDGYKGPSPAERENIAVVRKSIVASRHILKGETLSEKNLTTKRPGTGISPMRWHEAVGAIAERDYEENDLIEL